jgi:hypothetical protein
LKQSNVWGGKIWFMPGFVQKSTNTVTPDSVYFFLLLFVVKNKNYFTSNMEIHDIHTHNNYNLYLPSTNLSVVQKACCSLEASFLIIYLKY